MLPDKEGNVAIPRQGDPPGPAEAMEEKKREGAQPVDPIDPERESRGPGPAPDGKKTPSKRSQRRARRRARAKALKAGKGPANVRKAKAPKGVNAKRWRPKHSVAKPPSQD